MSGQEDAPQGYIIDYRSDIGSWDDIEVYDPTLHSWDVRFEVDGETLAIPERSATVLGWPPPLLPTALAHTSGSCHDQEER